jgi:hypothetical protein
MGRGKFFEDWYSGQNENFWIYSTDCGIQMGIWRGYDKIKSK